MTGRLNKTVMDIGHCERYSFLASRAWGVECGVLSLIDLDSIVQDEEALRVHACKHIQDHDNLVRNRIRYHALSAPAPQRTLDRLR